MAGLALLFPGQGAHAVGMGQCLYESYASVRELYDQADALVDFDLKKLSFEGPEEELRRTDVSQPAIVVASLAALRALSEELGEDFPEVGACCGMSLGEYTALTHAGALELGDTLRLVALRGQFMQEVCEASPSGMLALMGPDAEAVKKLIAEAGFEGQLGVANDNAPRQVIVSGPQEALDAFAPKAKEGGARRCMPLKVAGAYHSSLMVTAGEKLGAELAKVEFKMPSIPVVANVHAAPYESAEAIAPTLVAHVSSTVRWRETMNWLSDKGFERALELGPGTTLKGLVKKNARSIQCSSALTVEQVKAAAQEIREQS